MLIRDLLTLSRVDAAPDVATDPALVVVSVVDDASESVARQQGTISSSVAHAHVRCSDGLLRQVLSNLVENAMKYHGTSPPKIEVEGRERGGFYELRVADNGMGIPDSELSHVFDPFFRGTHAPEAVPGTGLGLSIVKRVAEACGGGVAVRSKEGIGSTFLVDLPLARPT
jgi:signal transduction histidine kinase